MESVVSRARGVHGVRVSVQVYTFFFFLRTEFIRTTLN